MKLLDKKTIAQKKSVERKLEIDEGAKLAKKIDALRETVSKEESNLAKFRIEAVKSTKADIDRLIAEKDVLFQEVEILKSQRLILQMPLDEEWEKINQKEAELIQFGLQLNEQYQTLRQNEKDLDIREEELVIEEERVSSERSVSINNLARSEKEKEQAIKLKHQAQDEFEKITKSLSQRETELNFREINIAARERDNKNKEQNIDKKERELNDRERSINDKYQTLLRTQKHYDSGNRTKERSK